MEVGVIGGVKIIVEMIALVINVIIKDRLIIKTNEYIKRDAIPKRLI